MNNPLIVEAYTKANTHRGVELSEEDHSLANRIMTKHQKKDRPWTSDRLAIHLGLIFRPQGNETQGQRIQRIRDVEKNRKV